MRKLLAVAALALLAGCDSALESFQQQEKWKGQEVHDYRFVYTALCFCGFVGPNPAVITVRNDVVSKVEYLPGSSGGSVTATAGYPTIDSLFARINRAHARGADRLDVQYDETYEFPKLIQIDYSESVADDEITYKVENFITLSADQEKE